MFLFFVSLQFDTIALLCVHRQTHTHNDNFAKMFLGDSSSHIDSPEINQHIVQFRFVFSQTNEYQTAAVVAVAAAALAAVY